MILTMKDKKRANIIAKDKEGVFTRQGYRPESSRASRKFGIKLEKDGKINRRIENIGIKFGLSNV